MRTAARDAFLVFAKRPEPGAVKTRLCPPFTPAQAADFYAAMLADVLETTATAAERVGAEALLAVWPPDALGALARRAPPAFRVVAQHGADLASRMAHAFAEQWAAGRVRVLLRGSDSPAMAPQVLDRAHASLADHDLVLVPGGDGGYDLVGLRRPAPGLFDHPMSTGRVLEETLAGARRLGLSARVLEPGFDVDTADDLVRLARVRAEGRGAGCRRSFAWLDAHGLWPPAGGA